MTQYDWGTIDPTVTSGTELASDLDQFRDAIESSHQGLVRPSYAQAGMIWVNNSSIPWAVNFFDGTNDDVIGYIDPSASIWMPVIGGGVGSDIASSTMDLGLHQDSVLDVSGSGSVTSFGSSATVGSAKFLRFGTSITIIASSNIITPSGLNIITQVGDQAILINLGSGIWTIFGYFSANNQAAPPGLLVPFSGFTAPPGWLLAQGQAVSIASYQALYNNITIQATGNTVSGQGTITNLSTTTNMQPGMPLCGPTIPAGAKIGSISGTSITMASGAVASGSATGTLIVVAPWGVGNGSSTFNVPNITGRMVAGLDASQALITTATVNFPIIGGSGGQQEYNLSQAQLPNVTLAFSPTNSYAPGTINLTHSDVQALQSVGLAAGGNTEQLPFSPTTNSVTLPSYTPSGTVSLGGSGTAINNMPPFVEALYIVKI
jgi:microcystin-dependent protein